jgi:Domain of unknown function (DUF4129)
MRLEDVSAQLRPRGPWEAVDLGFALTRRHFPLIISAWMLTVVPLWVALLVLTRWVPTGLIVFSIWWMKPLYDRVPLFILGRALFGAPPRLREVLRAWPAMLWGRFGRLMLLSRLSAHRALVMPVVDLEGQRGTGYSERAGVLKRQAGSTASALMFFAVLYELALIFGLFSFIGMATSPEGGATQLWEAFVDAAFVRGHMPGWLQSLVLGGWLVALTLVELFYVGGGFGLYLNCRTHLEGWDVELAFKRLVRRLGKAGVIVCAVVLAGSAGAVELEKPRPASGGADPVAQETIERVIKHPDFTVHKAERYVSQSKGGAPTKFGNWSWLEMFGAVTYWALIAGAVLCVAWLIYKNRHVFNRVGTARAKEAKPSGPRTVMGLDLSPESLPADIAAAAWELWRAGDSRGALSLLYRGSLSWLVHVARLPVRDCDTEGDCVRIARGLPEPARHEYFEHLTGQWVRVAYAAREPAASDMERLLNTWPFAEKGGAR